MIERFSEKSIKVIMLAQEEMRRLGYDIVGSSQLLLGLIGEGTSVAAKALRSVRVSLKDARQEIENQTGRGAAVVLNDIAFTPNAKEIFRLAWVEAKTLGLRVIEPEHLLMGLLKLDDCTAVRVLERLEVDRGIARNCIIELLDASRAATARPPERHYAGLAWLNQFGTDLTNLAAAGRLDPIAGREQELDTLIGILSQRSKANVLLVGESGVGKSAIVRGLAARIFNCDAPQAMLNYKIVSLDVHKIIGYENAYKMLEESLAAARDNKIILVIDEVHALLAREYRDSVVGNMLSILSWFLKHEKLCCIGITDTSCVRASYSAQPALLRNFRPMIIRPCSAADTVRVLQALRSKLENYHSLGISDEAIPAAVALSDSFVMDRVFPEKAVLILDEACALVKLQKKKHVALCRTLGEIRSDIEIYSAKNDLEQVGSLRKLQDEVLKSLNEETRYDDQWTVVTAADVAQVIRTARENSIRAVNTVAVGSRLSSQQDNDNV